MRVLQVITDTDRRGAQVFASDLAGPLRARGHQVDTVALVAGRTGGLAADALGRRWPSVRIVSALRRRMAGADITIAHGSSTGPACAVASTGSGRPFVYRQISDSRFWAPTRSRRARVRAVLGRARAIVALSDFNRTELVEWIGVRPDRVVVVPNGVPAARFSPPSPEARTHARAELAFGSEPILLFVGALVPEKGADLAIRVLGAVPHAHLAIVGAGPERAALERLATSTAPGRVHFAGARDDPLPYYQAADLVVLPSRGGDAMPAVLVEAGLCGLPTVSTRIGAIPEVVVDGVTGVVVEPDDASALGRAVDALLADPSARLRAGAAARDRCMTHFEIERVAEAWDDVLTRAANDRRR